MELIPNIKYSIGNLEDIKNRLSAPEWLYEGNEDSFEEEKEELIADTKKGKFKEPFAIGIYQDFEASDDWIKNAVIETLGDITKNVSGLETVSNSLIYIFCPYYSLSCIADPGTKEFISKRLGKYSNRVKIQSSGQIPDFKEKDTYFPSLFLDILLRTDPSGDSSKKYDFLSEINQATFRVLENQRNIYGLNSLEEAIYFISDTLSLSDEAKDELLSSDYSKLFRNNLNLSLLKKK